MSIYAYGAYKDVLFWMRGAVSVPWKSVRMKRVSLKCPIKLLFLYFLWKNCGYFVTGSCLFFIQIEY
ncbi:MAG: hypothetical protein IJE27_02430, partial [Anaerotignum sp.]|nr:hypothetical protein [Anaerotignum sp.]